MKDFRDVLIKHSELYPQMSARDIYKLIFHSAMGPGHAVSDSNIVKEWMDFELNNLEDYEDKEMLDELCPESGLVRVNLRPFVKSGGDSEKLCRIFIDTANTFVPNTSMIRKLWKQAEELSAEGRIRVSKEEMDEFFMNMEALSFPAARHSDEYTDNYKPAYRVVSKEYFDAISPKKRLTSI